MNFWLSTFHTSEGYHVVMYPFEGRFVHEGMAALIAYRMAQDNAHHVSLSP
jgi:ATP-dependent Lhr-like helicase